MKVFTLEFLKKLNLFRSKSYFKKLKFKIFSSQIESFLIMRLFDKTSSSVICINIIIKQQKDLEAVKFAVVKALIESKKGVKVINIIETDATIFLDTLNSNINKIVMQVTNTSIISVFL